jgi:hypothetical protein
MPKALNQRPKEAMKDSCRDRFAGTVILYAFAGRFEKRLDETGRTKKLKIDRWIFPGFQCLD